MTKYQGQLALKDVAEFANVSRPTVSNWRTRNESFPQPTEASTARRPLFNFDEIIDWLEQQGLLPEDWEVKADRLAVISAINPLTAFGFNPIDATLFSLAIMAANKLTDGRLGEDFSSLGDAQTDEGLETLEKAFKELSTNKLTHADPTELLKIAKSLPDGAVSTLVTGLTSVPETSCIQASDIIIETLLGNAGRSAYGFLSTNESAASRLISAAASTTVDPHGQIYDPTCGIASTLLTLHKTAPAATFIGNDIDLNAVSIASLRGYLMGVDSTFTSADIFAAEPQKGLKADTIVCEPPFGLRLDNKASAGVAEQVASLLRVSVTRSTAADLGFLSYPLTHLTDTGRAYMLTPLNLVGSPRYAQFRQKLVASGAVEAVIQLPRKLLTHTSLATALWVLRAPDGGKGKDYEVLVADASDAAAPEENIAEWLTAMRAGEQTTIPTGSISLAKLVTSGGNLLPAHALQTPDKEKLQVAHSESIAAIGSLADRLKQQLADYSNPSGELPTASTAVTIAELIDAGELVRVRTRLKNPKQEPSADDVKVKLVPYRAGKESQETAYVPAGEDLVQKGDIIIPNIVTVPARVFDETGEWAPPSGMFALRVVGEKYTPQYLVACVNAAFNAVDDGGMIPRRRLQALSVPALPMDEQNDLLDSLQRLHDLEQSARALAEQVKSASDSALSLVRYAKSAR